MFNSLWFLFLLYRVLFCLIFSWDLKKIKIKKTKTNIKHEYVAPQNFCIKQYTVSTLSLFFAETYVHTSIG